MGPGRGERAREVEACRHFPGWLDPAWERPRQGEPQVIIRAGRNEFVLPKVAGSVPCVQRVWERGLKTGNFGMGRGERAREEAAERLRTKAILL